MNFKIHIEKERCKGCGYCINACLQAVLKMSKALNLKGNHFPEVEKSDACTGCRRCASMCPDTAIKISKVYSESDNKTSAEKK
ncbi:MAG: ferredoxin family protein [Kiritimatiellae bacterium]|nr:ferredoxin family protein [Kiritimatiellia bacterium]MDD5520111.1 ferredoxin family protein [Kiritimatiellia bacterium]